MILQSSTAGISYSIWLRARWLILATIAGMLATFVLGHAAPQFMREYLMLPAILTFCTLITLLIGALTNTTADLAARESGVPRFMLTLPATSRALANVPMAIGAIICGCFWIGMVKLLLNPIGVSAPLVWPAVAGATVCAWLQATTFAPFWLPMLRVFCAIGVVFALIAMSTITIALNVNEVLTATVYGAVLFAAFPIAAAGIARARRGDGTTPPWAGRRSVQAAPLQRASVRYTRFTGAGAAQFWYECRRNILLIPSLAIAMVLLVLVAAGFGGRTGSEFLYIQGIMIPTKLLPLSQCVLAPLMMSALLSGMLGKMDAWSHQTAVPSFFASKPISVNRIIAAKFKAAALAVALMWAAIGLLSAGWSIVPGSFDRTQTLAHWIAIHATWRHVFYTLLIAAAAMFYSWKLIATSLFINLYGRRWLATVGGIGWMLVWMAAAFLGRFVWQHPRLRADLDMLLILGISILMLTRIVALVITLRTMEQAGLLTRQRAVSYVSMWLIAAALLYGIVMLAVPPARHWPAQAACGMLLFLPIVRLLLAPLALHYNRHR